MEASLLMNIPRATRLVWLAAICFGTVRPAPAADVDPMLPSDTEIVAQVNVRQLLDSPLVKQHALELMKNALKSNPPVEAVFQELGLNPFTDVDSITLAGPGGNDPNKGVAIVHGKFDLAKFKTRAQDAVKEGAPLSIEKSGNYTVYEVNIPEGPAQTLFVALPDAKTLVASPKKELLADALDKHAGKKKGDVSADLTARVRKHVAGESAWIVVLSRGLNKGPVATDANAKEFLDKSVTLSSSVTVTKDVILGATIDAKNADDATALQKKLSGLIDQGKGILDAFAQSQKELAPLQDLANSLKVTAADKTVTVSGTIPNAVIEKAIQRK